MTWTIDTARRQYNIEGWSTGYFDIGAQGHLMARPGCAPATPEVDLYEMANKVHDAGLSWPVLVRFTDILHHQVDRLCMVFHRAIAAPGEDRARYLIVLDNALRGTTYLDDQ